MRLWLLVTLASGVFAASRASAEGPAKGSQMTVTKVGTSYADGWVKFKGPPQEAREAIRRIWANVQGVTRIRKSIFSTRKTAQYKVRGYWGTEAKAKHAVATIASLINGSPPPPTPVKRVMPTPIVRPEERELARAVEDDLSDARHNGWEVMATGHSGGGVIRSLEGARKALFYGHIYADKWHPVQGGALARRLILPGLSRVEFTTEGDFLAWARDQGSR